MEKREAERRQAQAEGKPRGVKVADVRSGNFPEEKASQAGRTRDKVGAAIGMSGKTYEKAKEIPPLLYPPLPSCGLPSTLASSWAGPPLLQYGPGFLHLLRCRLAARQAAEQLRQVL